MIKSIKTVKRRKKSVKCLTKNVHSMFHVKHIEKNEKQRLNNIKTYLLLEFESINDKMQNNDAVITG